MRVLDYLREAGPAHNVLVENLLHAAQAIAKSSGWAPFGVHVPLHEHAPEQCLPGKSCHESIPQAGFHLCRAIIPEGGISKDRVHLRTSRM